MDDATCNKAQKFVRIYEMIQRRGGVTADELMSRFELDARTLRRYLADLHDLGLPLQDHGQSSERVIALDPAYGRSGVYLTLAEVLSLHFGRTLFTFLEGTSFASDIDGAIERLRPAIARSTADQTRDLDRKFMAISEHAKDYRSDPDLLDEVVSALLYGNPVDAEYRPARGGFGKIYRLEPYTLATYRQGLYLFARDVAEDKVKSFAVERFVRFSRLRREHFEYPASYDPHYIVRHSFGITGGQPEEIVVRFVPDVSLFVREREWHPTQQVELLGDGGVRLRMYVANSPELREWLLGFGAHVRVEAPESLAVWVRDQHLAAAAVYGGA